MRPPRRRRSASPTWSRGADAVIHLAANADVRFGWDAPRRDLEQNVLATHNVLEAMRAPACRRLLVLLDRLGLRRGRRRADAGGRAVPGADVAVRRVEGRRRGLHRGLRRGGSHRATVFRFVSMLGPRYSHGHVIDFVRQLHRDPTRLRILGDGTQRKSYMHVDDCVAAVIVAGSSRRPAFEVFNLGVDGYCTVTRVGGLDLRTPRPRPEFEYTGGDRGWIGDNPFIYLDTARHPRHRLAAPSFGIREAVERTVDYLARHRWILGAT